MGIQRLNLGAAEMRRRLEAYFGEADEGDVSGIERWIVSEHKRNNPNLVHDRDDTLCDEDRLEMCEAIWDLIREGNLNPGGRAAPQTGWPAFYVTAKGGQYFGNK